MNRRSFFKMITGFVAGVYAAFAPKKSIANMSQAKKDKMLGIDALREYEKRSGTEFVPKTKTYPQVYGRSPMADVIADMEKHEEKRWITTKMDNCYVDNHGILHMEQDGYFEAAIT